MKKATANRIINNTRPGGPYVIIGRYSYCYDFWRHVIRRCKTDDVGRAWIDSDGNQFDAWEDVLEVPEK